MQVCLIGKSRTYPPAGEASMDVQRTRYIHRRRGCPPAPGAAASSADRPDGCPDGHGTPDVQAEGLWLPGFRPREKAERLRNCATLPRDFVDQVVLQVADLLLGGKRLNPRSSPGGRLKAWNRGGNRLRHWGTCWVSGSDSVSLVTSLQLCGRF